MSLITFDGIGCENCPFYNFRYTREYHNSGYCGLSGRKDINIELGEIVARRDRKPDNCPFKDGLNSVEVVAHDTE